MTTYIVNYNTVIKTCLDLLNIQYKTLNNNDRIEITAKYIQPLSSFLNISKRDVNLGINVILDLIAQIKHYEKNKVTVPFIHFDNIIVINNSIFLLIDPAFYPILNRRIYIKEAYPKTNEFLCDEIKNNQQLPFSLSYKCVYQSIALMILKIIFKNTNIENVTNITYTRLGWCLERCLNPRLEDRELIYF